MAEKLKKEQDEATKIAKVIIQNPVVVKAINAVINAKKELEKTNNSILGFGKFFNEKAQEKFESSRKDLTAVISEAVVNLDSTKIDEVEKAMINFSLKAKMALLDQKPVKNPFAPKKKTSASEVVPVRKTKKLLSKKGIVPQAEEKRIEEIGRIYGKDSPEYKNSLKNLKKKRENL